MEKIPTMEELVSKAVEMAINEYEFEGKTIREWVNLIENGKFAEVVRCKDCKYWDCYGEGESKGDCLKLEGLSSCMYEEDFCSYGETRGS